MGSDREGEHSRPAGWPEKMPGLKRDGYFFYTLTFHLGINTVYLFQRQKNGKGRQWGSSDLPRVTQLGSV